MSRDWTPAELQAASEAMKAAGHMSYEEFCAALPQVVVKNAPTGPGNKLNRHLCRGIGKHLPTGNQHPEGDMILPK